jgi:uncharacterized protein with ParB-like and HNH nuclease domain/predicted transport protein
VKATEAKLLDFLKKSPQFVIPIYQRTYSWTEKECRQLWTDILRTGGNDALSAHFVGSIVYIEKGLSNLTSQEPMLVIDGQQRLTTLTLLLAALIKVLEKLPEDRQQPIEGFSPRKLRNYYLLNPDEDGEKRFKLLLTQTDKTSLIAVVDNGVQPKEPSLRVTRNFELFQQLLDESKDDLRTICQGLAKLVVVDIALNRSQDNPQLIFESMNSTGRELSQADLIRNFILMGLEPQIQTRLYEQYWRPMEVDFGQEEYSEHFDAFMRHYLTVKSGEIPRLDEVYDAFKILARATDTKQAGVEALVKEVRDFARYFCAMALGAETDPELKLAFNDLRELKVDVAYPFLLELYQDFTHGILPKPDFLAAVRLVESYVFRRAICEIPTNSMNKTFGTFTKVVKKDNYLEGIQAHFLSLPSYRRFPGDEEFQRDIQTRDLYKFRSRSYWLRRMENHGRKERVSVEEYTIEHILPQNENLPPAWKAALGPEWERIQQTWLHTLGNLTLTGYNSEYSDRPFPEKRDLAGGFKESPLKLNAGLGAVSQWDETAIKSRAQSLSNSALKVWEAPRLSAEILARHREKPADAAYDLDHYPQLLLGPVRVLFDALRKEVLALDSCVSEDFLKYYIAFKAESSFVIVLPQSNRLKLILFMPPKSICKEISRSENWGNGEIKVFLESMDYLPYILGLVRQSLERQLGDGSN